MSDTCSGLIVSAMSSRHEFTTKVQLHPMRGNLHTVLSPSLRDSDSGRESNCQIAITAASTSPNHLDDPIRWRKLTGATQGFESRNFKPLVCNFEHSDPVCSFSFSSISICHHHEIERSKSKCQPVY